MSSKINAKIAAILAVPFLVAIPTIAAETDTDDMKVADTDETGDGTSEGDSETADIAVIVASSSCSYLSLSVVLGSVRTLHVQMPSLSTSDKLRLEASEEAVGEA